MVTITNGVKTFRITAGAVKPYLDMGFYIATDAEVKEMNRIEKVQRKSSAAGMSGSIPPKADNTEHDESEEVDEEAMFIEELLEKPLSQWSNDEVKEFVRIKDIDTSGAQKVSQVRGIIKSYLEEQQKNA